MRTPTTLHDFPFFLHGGWSLQHLPYTERYHATSRSISGTIFTNKTKQHVFARTPAGQSVLFPHPDNHRYIVALRQRYDHDRCGGGGGACHTGNSRPDAHPTNRDGTRRNIRKCRLQVKTANSSYTAGFSICRISIALDAITTSTKFRRGHRPQSLPLGIPPGPQH